MGSLEHRTGRNPSVLGFLSASILITTPRFPAGLGGSPVSLLVGGLPWLQSQAPAPRIRCLYMAESFSWAEMTSRACLLVSQSIGLWHLWSVEVLLFED